MIKLGQVRLDGQFWNVGKDNCFSFWTVWNVHVHQFPLCASHGNALSLTAFATLRAKCEWFGNHINTNQNCAGFELTLHKHTPPEKVMHDYIHQWECKRKQGCSRCSLMKSWQGCRAVLFWIYKTEFACFPSLGNKSLVQGRNNNWVLPAETCTDTVNMLPPIMIPLLNTWTSFQNWDWWRQSYITFWYIEFSRKIWELVMLSFFLYLFKYVSFDCFRNSQLPSASHVCM